MTLRPAARARVANSPSTYLNVNSEIAGMFDRNTSTAEPAGEMSSVEILSPSLITTDASSVTGTGSPSGTGLMFGPRGISPWPSDSTNPTVEVAKRGSNAVAAWAPRVRGSVMTPVSAEAAATSDEQRYTSSPLTPLRPGKFRLNARRLFTPAAGTWPMPAHEPHVDSDTVAPAASRSVSSPSRAMVSRILWLPGNRTNDTDGCTRRPLMTSVTDAMSYHEPLVQEPTITCSTWVPATSSTGTTRSGEPGSATSGVSVERSSSISSSYVASSSGASGRQSSPRPRRVRNERVTSSLGKMLVVSPSSAPMLAIVIRC